MTDQDWITAKEAAQLRKCTERNILQLIKKNELEARKEGHRWLIRRDSIEKISEKSPNNSEFISVLKAELQEKNDQIRNLQERLEQSQRDQAESSERSDTLLLALTQQNQQLLEDKRPWYQRMFKKRGRE